MNTLEKITLPHPLFDAVLHDQAVRVLSLLNDGMPVDTRYPKELDWSPSIGTQHERPWEQLRDWTPLHLAAMLGRLEMARLLLDRGAEIEATTPDGKTPLLIAINHSQA